MYIKTKNISKKSFCEMNYISFLCSPLRPHQRLLGGAATVGLQGPRLFPAYWFDDALVTSLKC